MADRDDVERPAVSRPILARNLWLWLLVVFALPAAVVCQFSWRYTGMWFFLAAAGGSAGLLLTVLAVRWEIRRLLPGAQAGER